MGDTAAYQVSLPGQTAIVDVFGLWQEAPAGTVYVELGSQPGSIWRADLPVEAGEADLLLARQDRLSTQGLGWLQQADARLAADLAELPPPEQATSYDVNDSWLKPGQGARLEILAAAAQRRWEQEGMPVHYSLFDSLKLDDRMLEKASQEVDRFNNQVQTSIVQLAQVETVIGGQVLAVTQASWSGDLQTWWAPNADHAHIHYHRRVLAQAMATRRGWLRFFTTILSGAARLAAALSTGPFSILAIWSAWNYLQQVVGQVRRLQEIRRIGRE
jgi:hypothetical protein